MSFLVTAIGGSAAAATAVTGAAASIAGAAIASKRAKSAAKTAAAGSQADIDFQRESRDLARGDQAPYREAGGKALDALMSMTGLGGPVSGSGSRGSVDKTGSSLAGSPWEGSGYTLSSRNGQYVATDGQGGEQYWNGSAWGSNPFRQSGYTGPRNDEYNSTQGRAYGGNISGGALYNVNELGPENVFNNGAVTRSSNPRTIPPSPTGYVGRAMGGPLGVVDPRQGVSGGIGPGPKDGASGYVNPNIPPKTGAYQPPQENPGGVEGGYNFQTDPGYEFRVGEGQRAIERSAAARGGLLSGGTGRALQRYGQDYASNEYTNVYNRIANIAGLGQVSAGQSGQYAMYAGQGMGTAAAQGAQASAYGQQASGNAWANAANQIGQLPWGSIFKPRTGIDDGYSYPYNPSYSG